MGVSMTKENETSSLKMCDKFLDTCFSYLYQIYLGKKKKKVNK